MSRYRVSAKGVEVGQFIPTAQFDSPKNCQRVFGLFTPGEAYANIAHLFRFSDDRGGSDWDDRSETKRERAALQLRLYTEAGELFPTENLVIYDCVSPGMTCELHVTLPSLAHVELLLRDA